MNIQAILRLVTPNTTGRNHKRLGLDPNKLRQNSGYSFILTLFEHLKIFAKMMRVETYGEIADAIEKKEGRRIAPVSLNKPLGFIRDEICRKHRLPWLNVLAVNSHTWTLGDSFLPPGVAIGKDEEVLWRGAVLAVFGYHWECITVD